MIQRPHNIWYIYTLVSLAVIFWGVSYVWTKTAFTYYQPITVMLIRLTISSILMFVIFKVRRYTERVDPADYKAFLILSLFSPFFYFIGENFGVYHVSPTVAAVVIATIPVFSPILGYVAFREKVTFLNVMGFIISFSGVLIMVLDADLQFTASPVGVFWLFFAVFSALVNIIFLKKLAAKYSSFTIILVQNFLGALFFLPLFLLMDLGEFVHIRPSWQAVASLFALAVFGSTLAFMFYTSGVRVIGIARTAIFANLIPVVTAITSFLFLKEVIDLSRIIGMLIVIGGLFLTQLTKLRKRRKDVVLSREADFGKKTEKRL
ncbi:MAG: DMT family transporter [Bacteroidia bacterium]|nr:MAG: DMT family transporter [Bacteroidia bacterium]